VSKVTIICDFDGTITTMDVGSEILRRFGDNEARQKIYDQYQRGELSLYQLQKRLWPTVRVTKQQLFDHLDNWVELRDGFEAFTLFCKTKKLPIQIVSGGFDLYIDFIKAKFGIDLPHISNSARLVQDTVEVDFPHYNQISPHFSICKGTFIRNLREKSSDKLYIIGIGDGWSDRSFAKDVDLLFACDDLEKYCQQHKIAHSPFTDFNDILKQLQNQFGES
jgi:2,3-diketo-5-methylthio-1-phosphopentane phosphatase